MSMIMIAAVPLIPLSGFAYRLRGSAFASDWPLWLFGKWRCDRIVKLAIGSAPVAIGGAFCGLSWWLVLAVWVATAITDAVGHAKGQGLDLANYWPQVKILVSRGLLSALPIAGALAWSGAWLHGALALALGLSIWPAYHFGNRLPINVIVPLVPARQGPEVGEWFYGFTRALFALVCAGT